MSEKKVVEDKSVAVRRWRNMMIASTSGHSISGQRREYLEQMRKKLGISVEEARHIVDEYRHMGGGITLFGDKYQRLQVFRDIISMLLVDGGISEKGRALLLRISGKLGIDETMLDHYIQLSLAAIKGTDGEADSHESQRLSRRVFRRMVSDSKDRESLLKEFDSLDRSKRRELELKVLEEYAQEHSGADSGESRDSLRTRRYKAAYLEDQRCAALLLGGGKISEAQLKPFQDKQQNLYETEGRVVSFLTEMVKGADLDKEVLAQARAAICEKYGDLHKIDGWEEKTEGELGGLRISCAEITLDQTFWVSCLTLEGYLDHNSVEVLQKAFDRIFSERKDSSRLIIMEMGGLSYISSAGVGAILSARATTLDRWGDIRFVNVSHEAQEIFTLIGVDHVFTFCQDIDEALWSFTDLAIARDVE